MNSLLASPSRLTDARLEKPLLHGSSQRETMLPDDPDPQARPSPGKQRFKLKRTQAFEDPTNEPDDPLLEQPLPAFLRESAACHLNQLWDSLGPYDSAIEDPSRISEDDLQWGLRSEADIPDQFKADILAYKNALDPEMTLKKKLDGQVGVLYYLMKNKLMAWFFESNRKLTFEFGEVIQDAVFTTLKPNCELAGIPKAVLVVSLESQLVFKTVILRSGSLQLIEHCPPLNLQVDGIFFDPRTLRLFVASRDSNHIQELLITDARKVKVRSVVAAARSEELVHSLTDGFKRVFRSSYSYRTHTFALDSRLRTDQSKYLYQLVTKWKRGDGVTDLITEQMIKTYKLTQESLAFLGHVDVEQMVSSTIYDGKPLELAKRSFRERRVAGIMTGSDNNWDLTIMLDNEMQIQLKVLESNAIIGPHIQCALARFIGSRLVDVGPSPPRDSQLLHSSSSDLNASKATAFVNLEGIQTRVMKTCGDSWVRLTLLNRTDLTTSASALTGTQSREPMRIAKPLTSHSFTQLLRQDYYADLLENEVVFDSLAYTDVRGHLWESTSGLSPQLTSPVLRSHALAVQAMRDRLCVSVGDKVAIFERLGIRDLLYCILFCLDSCLEEKRLRSDLRTSFDKILKWDLILLAGKVGIQNFCAAVYSLILATEDSQFAVFDRLTSRYRSLAERQGFAELRWDLYSHTSTVVRTRKYALQVLREFGGLSQTQFSNYLASTGISNTVDSPHPVPRHLQVRTR